MMASPRAPDWDMNPTRPGRGTVGPKLASRHTRGSVLTMPRQLGPIRRMPAARQTASSSRWRSAPSGPISAKPAETTTMARTPLAAQSRAAWTTEGAGTASTARSTGPGTSSTDL